MVSQSIKRVLSCVFWSVILAGLISGGYSLKINELRVPEVIQNGTQSSVVLDCDYSFEDDPRDGLVIKWYFNNNPSPVYQWIFNGTPQGLGILQDKLNLNYRASEEEHSRHRAMQIINPTTELSGEYRCTVSTFDGEESQAKKMIVFVPPEKKIEVTQTKQNENSAVNITCSAEGVFPEPKLAILDKAGTKLESIQTHLTPRIDGLYDISASIVIEDDELESPTKFDCELEIPEANYTVKASPSLYYPGPPSNTTESPMTEANSDVDTSSSARAVLTSALLPLLALRL